MSPKKRLYAYCTKGYTEKLPKVTIPFREIKKYIFLLVNFYCYQVGKFYGNKMVTFGKYYVLYVIYIYI